MKAYDVNTPLNYFRPEVTPDLLFSGLKKLKATSPLSTLAVATAFVSACQRWNLDQVYLASHAILESGWGTSNIAVDKNNLFGYRAYDSSPYLSATTFKTKEACILFIAEFVTTQYLQPTGKWYSGASTLAAMNVHYATATHWSKSIADLCNSLESAMFKDRESILLPGNETKVDAPKIEGFVAHSRNVIVSTTKGINVRITPTTKETNIAQTLPYNATIPVEGYVTGEVIEGNSFWWKIKDKDYYIWSGGTNVVPSPTTEDGVGSVDIVNVDTLTKDQLIEKISKLETENQELKTAAINNVDAIKKLNTELEAKGTEIIKLGNDLGNYETTKKINATLSDQITAYQTKVASLKSDLKNSIIKSFEGWDLTEIKPGVVGLAMLPIVGFKLWTLIKGALTEGYVIGWKKGAKIYPATLDQTE